MPEPTDTAAPLDGASKDEASSFLESLGLSKVSRVSQARRRLAPARRPPRRCRPGAKGARFVRGRRAPARLGRPRARACTHGCATRLAWPTRGLRYWRLCVNGSTAG